MVGSPTGKIGGAYFTPYWNQQNARPDDMFLEPIFHLMAGGDDVLTCLTDTNYIDYASFAYPVPFHATTCSPAGISSVGTTITLNATDARNLMVYVFGSIGKNVGRIMRFPQLMSGGQKTNGVVWEILYATMDSSAGTYKCTTRSVLDHIDRVLYVLPIQVISTVPDTSGYDVNELSTIDFTVECGNSTVLAMLVGGISEAWTAAEIQPASSQLYPIDNAANIDQDLLEHMPLWLGGRESIRPGDLIGEIVMKTFVDGDSQSLVTVTAASDCEIIRHIELILPVCTNATEYPVAWSGTQGATSIVYTKDTCTDNVHCLVLGY